MDTMRKYLAMAFVAFTSLNVSAGNIWCTGKISNIYIDASKNVLIKGSWRNQYTRICKTDGSTSIDTVTCSLWVSLATTSMTHDKDVTLMYSDKDGAYTCANLPEYIYAPTPAYLMLVK